jgi:hypothetical protein
VSGSKPPIDTRVPTEESWMLTNAKTVQYRTVVNYSHVGDGIGGASSPALSGMARIDNGTSISAYMKCQFDTQT